MDHGHSLNLAIVATGVMLLYGLFMMVYGVRQASKVRGSYLVRKEGRMMLFRKPPPLRRSTLAAVGFLVLMLLAMVAAAPHMGNPALVYLQSVISLSLPAFFLYLSGPDDVRLDGSQRTYERTTGFPWKPVTRFGTFDGIKGVTISPQSNVLLLLEKPGFITKGVVLSSSGTKAAAEALVEDLRREFGFPIVPYVKR